MDYSQFRRSQNVEGPTQYDRLVALLSNPMRNQWLDPNGLNQNYRGLAAAQTAADFPTMPEPDPQLAGSGLAQQAGAPDIARLIQLLTAK